MMTNPVSNVDEYRHVLYIHDARMMGRVVDNVRDYSSELSLFRWVPAVEDQIPSKGYVLSNNNPNAVLRDFLRDDVTEYEGGPAGNNKFLFIFDVRDSTRPFDRTTPANERITLFNRDTSTPLRNPEHYTVNGGNAPLTIELFLRETVLPYYPS